MTNLRSPPDTPLQVITDPLVVHDQKLADYYLDRLQQRTELHGAFQRPEGLCMITWSNYPEKTIAEQSFDLLGIQGYRVLGRDVKKWTLDLKITLTLAELESDQCQDEYVFWMDARDAVLLGDPARAIHCLRQSGADVILTSTDWIAADLTAPAAFARSLAPTGCLTPYLNTGVVVARRTALIKLLRQALPYVGQSVSTITPTCDQAIITAIHKDHANDTVIDYWQYLALRPAISEPYMLAMHVPNALEEQWWWQALSTIKQLLLRLPAVALTSGNPKRHSEAVWAVQRRWVRLMVFMRERARLGQAISALRSTPWFR